MVDYYEVLELQRSASQADIRKSYLRLSLKWHPDKNPTNKEEAEKKFKVVAEAYEVLSDPQKRLLYDRSADSRSHTGRSATAGHNSFFDTTYIFQNPNEVFREVSGGMDPINIIRNSGRGRHAYLFPGFVQSFTPFAPFILIRQPIFCFTEVTPGFRTALRSTEVTNGKRITTWKIIENGQERIEVEEDDS